MSTWYAIKEGSGSCLCLAVFPQPDGWITQDKALAERAARVGWGSLVTYEHEGEGTPSYEDVATFAGTTWIGHDGRHL
jgi:hypothetical protein